jgi:putative nucleotidyltransferase with HDIG domain
MKSRNEVLLSSTTELVQIDVKELKMGMYVSKLDRPWLETSFLFQGFELINTDDINEVQKQCNHVYIDVTKQKYPDTIPYKSRNTAFSKGWLEDRHPPKKKSNFSEEFAYSESIFHHTSSIVKSFMEDIAFGRAINIEIAKKAVSECVESIMKSPDALMWLSQLKNADEYTSQHSMNVCIFSIALGRRIGLPVAELENIGLCGLMHDIGKMKIPHTVLTKPGKFTTKEISLMRSHSTEGWKLLMASSNMPGCVIDAAYAHHERLDGKGYPRGLTENQIHPYTRIVTISDMYDAITSDRVYKKSKTHLEAINIMTNNMGNKLDSGLVIKFIECLGIYPPGHIVEMTNGEVAVVIEVNEEKKLKPKITMLLDEDKKQVKPRLVDLAKMDLDACGQSYAVKRMVKYDVFNININQLYKMDLVRNSLAPH